MPIRKKVLAGFGLVVLGMGTLCGTIAAPKAVALSLEEALALENNLLWLCEASFDDLENEGIALTLEGEDALNYACDLAVDGIDDNDVSDPDFSAAMDLLVELLEEVTYE